MSEPASFATIAAVVLSLGASLVVGLVRRSVADLDRRIADAERVNREQADALHAHQLHLAQNHPDNADFGEVKTAIRDLTSAVVTLTTRIEVLTATR